MKNETVYCFNTETGALNWEKSSIELSWLCSPIIVNDVVYVGHSSYLLGLKLSDGSITIELRLYGSVNALNLFPMAICANTCGDHLWY
ncbi:MAG: hypothetical protein IPK57_14470 [Chitinophagaceae bacterium]|nr:hypothetical protein [Chitinophagaceae bacterium]